MSRQDYPLAPPCSYSRQTSNTSSIASALSAGTAGSTVGSMVSGGGCANENWETYTDASETEEADATDAYYAKVQAQQQQQMLRQQMQPGKRPAPGGGLQPLGGAVKRQQTIVEERVMSGGSEAWTDEGDGFVGETY